MKRVLSTMTAMLVLLFLLGPNTADAKSTCPKYKKSPQEKMMAEQKKMLAEQKKFEKNLRSLCRIMESDDLKKTLRVSESQAKQLDSLSSRYAEARRKVEAFNPKNEFSSSQQEFAARAKEAKLRELSTKAGAAVARILSLEQVNAYGMLVQSGRNR